MHQTFGKVNKLVSKKDIEILFANKKTAYNFPLKAHYTYFKTTKSEIKFVISAPKRIFKRAHDRNRIKRLMREAIRKNKLSLAQHLETEAYGIHVFVIYSNVVLFSRQLIQIFIGLEAPAIVYRLS